MNQPFDTDHLSRWNGNADTAEEHLTAGLIERFCATLSPIGIVPGPDGVAPRLMHYCLCQPAVPIAALGEDGHPARGGFLPPIPLSRRMWAGSAIVFHGDLKAGDVVCRRSHVADLNVKQGRTGALCFVTVDHVYTVAGVPRVEERQTIVYRAAQPVLARSTVPVAPVGVDSVAVDPSPTLLFRYSALTFNGHRIHYDAPYARDVEGYPGLVVHGPLQATLLLHFAARVAGRPPDRFEFKSVSSLFAGDAMVLHAGPLLCDAISLWTARVAGPVAMQAEARWS